MRASIGRGRKGLSFGLASCLAILQHEWQWSHAQPLLPQSRMSLLPRAGCSLVLIFQDLISQRPMFTHASFKPAMRNMMS